MAVKDEQGRVRTLVEKNPGSTVVSQAQDRTLKEKASTATSALKDIQNSATRRATTAKQSREKKKKEKEWQPKNKTRVHPVEAAEEEQASEEEESDDLEQAAFGEEVYVVRNKAIPSNVKIPVFIQGKKFLGTADTGAGRALIGTLDGKALSLRPYGPKIQLKGLGRLKGRLSIPVNVVVGDRGAAVQFCIVEEDIFPLLLGTEALADLEFNVDPKELVLRDRITNDIIATQKDPEIVLNVRNTVTTSTNVVTGVDESLGEEELIQNFKTLITQLTPHLEDSVRGQLWELLIKYKEVWIRPKLGRFKYGCASFTATAAPIKQKLRPLLEPFKSECEKQLQLMLDAGVIRPSKSPWGFCPVFVRKPTGEWRFCLDYRLLNLRIIADGYPLPLLWENLQSAAHHKYYITLDLNNGFWNLPLDEKSKPLTAIMTHMGQFEFNVLPFGIKNSPGEFQRAVDTAFSDLYGKGVLTYIDDIVIYGNDLSTMFNLFEEVLRRCLDVGFFVKVRKCEFLAPRVLLLGHIISESGIQPNPKKVSAVRDAPAPTSKEQVRSFLGAASFLRRFVPHFAEMAEPITRLLKKGVPFQWLEEQQQAYENLKTNISDQVLLTAPDGNKPYVLVTDASSVGIGAVLLQEKDEELVPLEFASKTLTAAEKKWDVREKEAFAIKWAVKKFEDYVKASFTTVFTDHESLRWMDNASSGRVQRWALFLQQFNLAIKHISGRFNLVADFLSRLPLDDGDSELIDSIAVPAYIVRDQLLHHDIVVPPVPSPSDFQRHYATLSPQELKDTFLNDQDAMRYSLRTRRLFIPQPLRDIVLFWFHVSRFGGHLGVSRTVRRMKKFVWWNRLAQDVREYVDKCLICKRVHQHPSAPTVLNILTKPRLFQLVSLDFVGPREVNGVKSHYIVSIDHASRFVASTLSLFPPQLPLLSIFFVKSGYRIFGN